MGTLDELDEDIITLKYLEEDYGHLVDVAISHVLDVVEKLRASDYETALELSRMFKNEDFWEKRQPYALQNYLEGLQL